MTAQELFRALAIVGVTACLLLSMSAAIRAGTPNGEQVATRELGQYDGRLSIGQLAGEPFIGSAPEGVVDQVVRLGGEGQWATEIVTADLVLDTRAAGEYNTVLYERDWRESNLIGRFALADGVWPGSAGEVAVSQQLARRYPIGSEIVTNSGIGRFAVTGIVTDIYYSEGLVIFAAVGTWDTLDFAALARYGSPPTANVSIYGFSVDWNQATQVVTESANSVDEATYFDDAASALLTRSEATEAALPPLTDRSPLVYAVPSAMVMVCVWVVWAGLSRRTLMRRHDTLTAVGVTPFDAKSVTAINIVLEGAFALAVGIVAGWPLSQLARAAVRSASTQPLRPLDGFGAEALRLAILSAAGGGVALAFILSRRAELGRGHFRIRVWSRRVLPTMRWLLSLALSLFVVWRFRSQSLTSDQSAIAWAAVAMAALWSDRCVDLAARVIGHGSLRNRLAARRVLGDAPRSRALVVALVMFVAPTLTSVVLRSSRVAMEERRWHSNVLQGQQAVVGSAMFDRAPAPEVVDLVANTVGSQPAYLTFAVVPGGDPLSDVVVLVPAGMSAELTSYHQMAGVDGVNALRQVVPSLTSEARSGFERGMALVFGSSGRYELVTLTMSVDGFTEVDRSEAFDAIGIDEDRAWSDTVAGFLPAAKLDRLTSGTERRFAVFSGIDREMRTRVKAALRAHAIPVDLLFSYREFELQPISTAVRVAMASLYVVFIGLVLSLVAAAAARMRRDSSLLVAIGLRPQWTRSVVVRQTLSLMLVALPLASCVAAVSIWVTLSRLKNRPLVVPWTVVGFILGVSCVGAVVVTSLVLVWPVRSGRRPVGPERPHLPRDS